MLISPPGDRIVKAFERLSKVESTCVVIDLSPVGRYPKLNTMSFTSSEEGAGGRVS